MEAILTIGIMGLIFIFFRKILLFIMNAALSVTIGSFIALFTKATLITGLVMAVSLMALLNSAYKSFFRLCKKILTRAKRYESGYLEKVVDILFSINISIMSILWIIGIVHTGIIYDFDISYLLEETLYAMMSVSGLYLLEKITIKK